MAERHDDWRASGVDVVGRRERVDRAAWVIGTLLGISIFFSGISRLVLSLTVRRRVA